MAYSPSNRTSNSDGYNNLQPLPAIPDQKQQRRMTLPAVPSSLDLPEDHGHHQRARPPSPLRNGFILDTSTGIEVDELSDNEDDEDDDPHGGWRKRSPSPSSSVSQLAATFAQRVGSLVSNIAPRSPGSMPTDAELEAEAERERDRSRREAERILTREAEERRLVEERVLAMMDSNRGSPKSLPPPPSRSQTLPNPPSPANSQKDGGLSWWTAAKNRLTPTKDKDPLTPAQQVIHEAKARDKEKKNGKGKEKEQDWPANSQGKFNDPAFLNLHIPVAPPKRRPVPSSPSSPTPSRPNISNMPPNLTPSPMRSADALPSSPSREPTPLYAQFNAQGTLDVHGTLLTIARRFEKLEKWTVGHVRALEERMSDVERWLVDKEKEKEISLHDGDPETTHSRVAVGTEMHEIREDVVELQGRVGELGREVAKLATAPANLSSGPSRLPAQVSVAPQTTSSIVVHSGHTGQSTEVATTTPTPHARIVSSTAFESTSPPMAPSNSNLSARTRLPYPSGDYSSPTTQDTHSPTNSPPASISPATHSQPAVISGLPGIGLGLGLGLGLGISHSTSSVLSSSPSGLQSTTSAHAGPPPKSTAPRLASVSPTPRKRYTVALGGSIADPSSPPERAFDYKRPGTPISSSRPQSSAGTAFFLDSPMSSAGGSTSDDERGGAWAGRGHRGQDEFGDDTIGKSASAKFSGGATRDGVNGRGLKASPPRVRAQSIYGLSSVQVQSPTAPLNPRLRTHSTDRFGVVGDVGSKFVDPLVLRRQDREARVVMPKPVGKVPIGQLVAFFDGDKR